MKRYYTKFKKTGIAKFKEKYKFFKCKYRGLIQKCKILHEYKLINNRKQKNLFNYIRNLSKNDHPISKITDSAGTHITDQFEISKAFNTYFISVFEKSFLYTYSNHHE